MNLFALFQALPLLVPEIARCSPLTMMPGMNPATTLGPKANPNPRGKMIV